MRRLAMVAMSLVMAGVVNAQTTKPGGLEVAANEAFGAGKYAQALPMLQTLATKFKDEPEKLGSIKEQISVCQKQIAAMTGASATAGAGQPAQQGPAVEMSAAGRTPHVKPKAGEVAAMAIPELGNFEYDAEKGGNIPKDVQEMAGSKIRVHGFMIPMDQAENITQFALVPSLFACCFGQPPQIQHTVVVNCPKGKAVSYCPDEIVVEGPLTVQEKRDDGYIVSIFELGANSVKVAAK